MKAQKRGRRKALLVAVNILLMVLLATNSFFAAAITGPVDDEAQSTESTAAVQKSKQPPEQSADELKVELETEKEAEPADAGETKLPEEVPEAELETEKEAEPTDADETKLPEAELETEKEAEPADADVTKLPENVFAMASARADTFETMDTGTEAQKVDSGTYESTKWVFYDNGLLTIDGGTLSLSQPDWGKYKNEITVVDFISPVQSTSNAPLFSGYENLEEVKNFGNFKPIGSMEKFFSGCAKLFKIDTSSFDTSKVTSMNSMFDGCGSLTELDVSGWDTSNVTTFDATFRNCPSITTLDVSNWDTSNSTTMASMFQNTGITNIDVSRWNTQNVTSMGNMFAGCKNLSALDLSGLDTGEVTSMYSMFNGSDKLKTVDVTGWDTSKVKDMSFMFYECAELKDLDVSGWDTGEVTNMSSMFYHCYALESLDVSSWNTSKVKTMRALFHTCKNLKELDVSAWDTSEATDMRAMFSDCNSLAQLDLSGWDTSKVTEMGSMFLRCTALKELDLSSFNTAAAAKKMSHMLNGCTNIQTLHLGSGFVCTDAVNLPAVAKANGYNGKWEKTDTTKVFASSSDFMKDYNPAVDSGTYSWQKALIFDVVYDGNTATGGSMAADTVAEETAYTFAKNAFIKDGHKFIGWSTIPKGAVEYADQTKIASWDFRKSMTFYAQWEQVEYTVTFHPNKGSSYTKTVVVGSKLAANDTYNVGHSSSGWWTAKTGGKRWVFDSDTMPKQNIHLYERETANTYTANYYNIRNGSKQSINYQYNAQLQDISPSITREGYEFVEWRQLETGEKWNFATATMPANDVNLLAHWRATTPVNPPVAEPSPSTAPTSTHPPPPTSTPMPSPSSSEAPVAPTSSPAQIETQSQNEQTTLEDSPLPLSGLNSEGWSLFNLLLSLLTMASALVGFIKLFTRKAVKDDSAENSRQPKNTKVLSFIASLAGVVPLALFFLLENFAAMILVSRWTPLIAAVAMVHIALAIMAKQQRKKSMNSTAE